MTTRARVREIHSNGLVDVEFPPAARCRGCEGSCTWFRKPVDSPLRLRAASRLVVGQIVRVSLPARYVLFGAILLHGFPWAMLLVGALAGAYVGDNDLSCLSGALLGLIGASVLVPGWQRKLESATAERLEVIPIPGP